MISAQPEPSFESLAARLIAKAQAIAEARLASRDSPSRWRSARLLWPLFAGK